MTFRRLFDDLFLRRESIDRWYSTGFGYVSHAKRTLPLLTRVRSRSSRSVKRYEQDETSVAFPVPFVAGTDGIFVGDQLQRDVRYWLSPPDPSTNHNFVRRARHSGTAAWFFESKALTEWKARGSFLWIHGKRMYLNYPTSSFANNLLISKLGRGKAHFCMW